METAFTIVFMVFLALGIWSYATEIIAMKRMSAAIDDLEEGYEDIMTRLDFLESDL